MSRDMPLIYDSANSQRVWKESDFKYLTPKDRLRAKRTLATEAIYAGDLTTWMKRLAEYSASQDGRVSATGLRAMAQRLSGANISLTATKVLIDRPDWVAYRQELVENAVLRARKQMESRAAEYAETHYQAMVAAKSNVSEDPKTAALITESMVDRIWPKKEDRDVAPTTVIVHLAPQQTVESVQAYEVLPVEIVESTHSR